MKNFPALQILLDSPGRIVIIPHHKPDGDALGAALALYIYLRQKLHKVSIISPTDFPHFLRWMPESKNIINWENKKKISEEIIRDADIVFCVDFNSLKRIDKLGELVGGVNAKKVMIDHHPGPDGFDDFRLWDDKASSTSELVYDFIHIMSDQAMINQPIAECLYTGILMDTGSFRFNSTTPKVHRIIASLLEHEVSPDKIHNHVYDSFSENRLRFYGYCMAEKLIILNDYQVAYIAVSAEEVRKYKLRTGDTEGLVNFPLALHSVRMAALIIDRTPKDAKDYIVKLSFRSKGNFPVNEFAKEHFDGGGHSNAAGGTSYTSFEDTITKFLDVIRDCKDDLLAD